MMKAQIILNICIHQKVFTFILNAHLRLQFLWHPDRRVRNLRRQRQHHPQDLFQRRDGTGIRAVLQARQRVRRRVDWGSRGCHDHRLTRISKALHQGRLLHVGFNGENFVGISIMQKLWENCAGVAIFRVSQFFRKRGNLYFSQSLESKCKSKYVIY